MDNPCFEEEARKGVYTIEEESRRARAPQHHHYDKPGGARKEGPKVATLAASILLATLIVLASTAALVYTLRTVNTSYKIGKASTSSSWASEMIVSGEFRITNEPFRPALYNLSSSDFKQLSGRIGKQLEELFLDSTLWSEVRNVAVTGLSPGLQVRCSLVLQPQDSLTIGKLGLAFLAGLNHSHGHLWLGPFTVDVLSIGFQASTEEVSWSQWSDWSECSLYKNGRLVRTRRRVCLTLEGLKLSRAEPCKAISKIGMNDTEIEPCLNMTLPVNVIQPKIRETTRTSEPSTSRTTNQPSTTTEFSWSQIVTKQPEQSRLQTLATSFSASESTMTPSTISMRNVANKSEEVSSTSINVPVRGWCDDCSMEEVCVALDTDPVPICRPSVDPSDPTGCGGLCRINTEICHRLGPYAYRCIDDSKCLDNEWQCGNTLCIPSIKRCDGHFNCYDHTDEHNCECNLNTHFQCGKNLSCLPLSKKCDGIVDCWDAADESNCTIACLDETQFTCNDSQCIPSKNFCDGFVDCKDHSDEPFGCGGVCKNHEWRCSNGRCIVKRDVCNGMDDCGDGSDEIKCGKRRFTTHPPDSK